MIQLQFTVTCNISTGSAKTEPRQHNFVFPSLTSTFIPVRLYWVRVITYEKMYGQLPRGDLNYGQSLLLISYCKTLIFGEHFYWR